LKFIIYVNVFIICFMSLTRKVRLLPSASLFLFATLHPLIESCQNLFFVLCQESRFDFRFAAEETIHIKN